MTEDKSPAGGPTVASLATKLASLDLDADERRLLVGLLTTEAEVEGFAYDLNPNHLTVLDESVNEIARFEGLLGMRLGGELPGLPRRFRC